MTRTVLRCAAPALLLVTLILVPFADKAFTIDDTFFLFQARHVLSDPLHPGAFETVWSTPPIRARASEIVPTGPVMAWLLAPSVFAGGSERVAHLTQLALFALAILATVSLALRLGLTAPGATCAGLLLAATPAALAMAGTSMPDIPAMALGVMGLERLVAWRDGRRAHQAVLAAVLLGLAPMARSHLVLLFGVGELLIAGDYLKTTDWRQGPWTKWLPLAAAPLLMLAVMLITRDPLGSSLELARAAASYGDRNHVPRNVVSFAVHWVLAIPLALPWMMLRPREVARRWWVFLLATGAAGLLLILGHVTWMLSSAPIAGLGATILVDVFVDAISRRDSVQLTLALWLLVSLPVAIYVHLPSKYLLASAPAAALLVARELSARARLVARWVVPVTAVAGVALGIAILRADAAFAGVGRRAARELVAPNVAAGQRVWFAANWGFQWYADRAGGNIVTFQAPFPAPGDLLVTSERTDAAPQVKSMLAAWYGARVRHLAHVEERGPGGRVMDPDLRAGFFSNAWGNYPWAWGNGVLDAFDLWRIE